MIQMLPAPTKPRRKPVGFSGRMASRCRVKRAAGHVQQYPNRPAGQRPRVLSSVRHVVMGASRSGPPGQTGLQGCAPSGSASGNGDPSPPHPH